MVYRSLNFLVQKLLFVGRQDGDIFFSSKLLVIRRFISLKLLINGLDYREIIHNKTNYKKRREKDRRTKTEKKEASK